MSLSSYNDIRNEILKRHTFAQLCKHQEFHAARKIQCLYRGYKCRQHIKYLNCMAILIQKTYRGYMGRKLYRTILEDTVQRKLINFYNNQAITIQKVYRGFRSRKTKFDYYKLKRWISLVVRKNYELLDTTWEYFESERNLKTNHLNEMARTFCIYIAKKLHHLLRTHQTAGIYSKSQSSALSHVEQLLNAFSFQKLNKNYQKAKESQRCNYLEAVNKFYEKSASKSHRYSRCEQFRRYRNVDQTENEVCCVSKEPMLKFGTIKYPYVKSIRGDENFCDQIIELTRKFDVLSPGKDFSLNTKIAQRPDQVEEFIHVLKEFCLLHNLISK